MSKQVTKKAEEQISNRVLTMFTLGAVVLWALNYIYKLIDVPVTHKTGYLVTTIVLIVSCMGIIAGVLWYALSRKSGNTRLDKVINGLSLAGFFAVLAVCSLLLLYNYVLGMKLIYVFIPAVVIFYLVYNVYQRVFFWLLLTEGIITAIVYFISNSYNFIFKLVSAITVVILSLFCILLSWQINKGKGDLVIGKKKISIFEKNTIVDIKATCLIYGLSSLIAIVCAFLPMTILFYIPFAFIGFLVCAAIYFTIRLM